MIWLALGITTEGECCDQPVDFLSIYPTLCELVNVPTPNHTKGDSIATLLKDLHSDWNNVALTAHGYRNHTLCDNNSDISVTKMAVKSYTIMLGIHTSTQVLHMIRRWHIRSSVWPHFFPQKTLLLPSGLERSVRKTAADNLPSFSGL